MNITRRKIGPVYTSYPAKKAAEFLGGKIFKALTSVFCCALWTGVYYIIIGIVNFNLQNAAANRQDNSGSAAELFKHPASLAVLGAFYLIIVILVFRSRIGEKIRSGKAALRIAAVSAGTVLLTASLTGCISAKTPELPAKDNVLSGESAPALSGKTVPKEKKAEKKEKKERKEEKEKPNAADGRKSAADKNTQEEKAKEQKDNVKPKLAFAPRENYPKLKDYSMQFSLLKHEFRPGKPAKLLIGLKNTGNSAVRLEDWRINTGDNIQVFVQNWLPGMKDPEPEFWVELDAGIKMPDWRYPLELYPGNQVLIEKTLNFVKGINVEPGMERRFFVKCRTRLQSIDVTSGIMAIAVRDGAAE